MPRTTRTRPSQMESHNTAVAGAVATTASATATASTRSRRAVLGDVSNRRRCTRSTKSGQKTDTEDLKQTTHPKPTRAILPKPLVNFGCNNENEPNVPRRSSRSLSRSTTKSVSSEASTSSRASSRIGATVQKTIAQVRGRVAKRANDNKTVGPVSKKARKTKNVIKCNARKPKGEVMSIASRVRSRTLSRSNDSKTSDKQTEKLVRSKSGSARRGRPLLKSQCSDFLAHTDYKLVREPFDASKYTAGIAPHDREHLDNPFQIAEYATDFFQRMHHEETISRPMPYMESQPDINSRMRSILVDWLVEVHMKFRLVPETLFLSVNIIDRYCSLVSVKRSKLQLVGVTALLVACKYEEIYPPEVRDCVYITDRAYSRQEVLDMEQDIVNRLKFKFTVPTAYPFLKRFLQITKASKMAIPAASYFMERTLQEDDLLQFRPSLVAASAVSLAINHPDIREKDGILEKPSGVPKILLDYTGFTKEDILECAEVIALKVGEEIVTASRRELVSVKRKYDSSKHLNISTAIDNPDIDDLRELYDL